MQAGLVKILYWLQFCKQSDPQQRKNDLPSQKMLRKLVFLVVSAQHSFIFKQIWQNEGVTFQTPFFSRNFWWSLFFKALFLGNTLNGMKRWPPKIDTTWLGSSKRRHVNKTHEWVVGKELPSSWIVPEPWPKPLVQVDWTSAQFLTWDKLITSWHDYVLTHVHHRTPELSLFLSFLHWSDERFSRCGRPMRPSRYRDFIDQMLSSSIKCSLDSWRG